MKFLLYREPLNRSARARSTSASTRRSRASARPRPGARPPVPRPGAAGGAGRAARRDAGSPARTAAPVYGAGRTAIRCWPSRRTSRSGRTARCTSSRAARGSRLQPRRHVAATWGRTGQGDGQFQEPWGIAVAPSGDVYVADTWNHRIQYFDSDGKFLQVGQPGRCQGQRSTTGPGVFWGPRVDRDRPGRRGLRDRHRATSASRCSTRTASSSACSAARAPRPASSSEPVGLALDAQGNVWVADTWNERIQKLDPTGEPLAQTGRGWESQNVSNKPYLAVDADGNIYATLPDDGEVKVLDPVPHQLHAVRAEGRATPAATGRNRHRAARQPGRSGCARRRRATVRGRAVDRLARQP